MIKISIISLAPNHNPDIEIITNHLNEQFISLKCTVTVSYTDKEDNYRLCIKYNHPDIPNQNSFTTLDTKGQEDLNSGLGRVLGNHLLQLHCQHTYERPKDRFGRKLEDGRGVCTKCGLEHPEALTRGGNKVISINSLGCDSGDISAQQAWPDGCFLQGGDKGVVVSLKKGTSYRTSFCEAFPNINGIKTFVRGEGKNILEAEQDCYSQYEKMRTCEAHEFSREVRGILRRDGYAICIHCGLSSMVLPPLDRCSVCDIPTNEKVGDTHYCTKHWLEQGFDALLEDRLESYQSSSLMRRISVEEASFDLHIEMEMKAFFLNELGEEGFDNYLNGLSTIKSYFKDALLRKYFGKKKLLMSTGFPTRDSLVLLENINHLKGNKDLVIEFLKGHGSLKTSDLIIL